MSSIGFNIQISWLQKICVMSDWPPQSPDLNIIEYMWSILKSKVRKRISTNADDLLSTVKEEWDNIPYSTAQFLDDWKWFLKTNVCNHIIKLSWFHEKKLVVRYLFFNMAIINLYKLHKSAILVTSYEVFLWSSWLNNILNINIL